MEHLPVVVSMVAVVISLLGLIDRYYGASYQFKEKVAERLKTLEERKIDPEILQRITALETKTGPFWRVLEEHMVELLKQPTHLRMDALLDDFKGRRDQMTLDELMELKCEIRKALDESMGENTKKAEGRTFGYVVFLGLLEYRISLKQSEPLCRTEGERSCTAHTIT